ncbi:unnamed protein product [Caenorhabditis auriculariae]|uniref:Uncharacterized protein n=1 Tax=Caenorhabditis auriculariae TaxID=2777116 RepID=A0A8S1GNF3_9PELO|nr:unnamed protein product [Caenorhabditis auriculariae]
MASTIESIKNSEDSFQQMLTTFNLKNSSNVNYDYVDFKLKKVREWMMDVLFENEGEHSFDELRQNLYVLGMSGHVATVRDDLQNYLSLCLQEELKRDRETWDFCPLDAFTNMWAVHRVKLKKILTICEQTDQHFCNLTNAESINVLYKKRLRKFLLENNLVLFIRNVMIDVYTLLRKNPDQKKINLLKRSTRTIVEIGNGDHQFFSQKFSKNAFLEKMQTLIGKMIGEVSNSGKGTCKTLKMIQEKMFNEGKLVSEAFGKETAERMAKVYAKNNQ